MAVLMVSSSVSSLLDPGPLVVLDGCPEAPADAA